MRRGKGLHLRSWVRHAWARPADIGWLRRAPAEPSLRRARDGLTLSHKIAPSAWAASYGAKSVLESPLFSYRPQEGTPDMMLVDVGTSTTAELTVAKFDQELAVGDIVRVTDAVTASGFGGMITSAVRAWTVGVVEAVGRGPHSSPTIRFVGYFDHPVGLPMVRERADGDA